MIKNLLILRFTVRALAPITLLAVSVHCGGSDDPEEEPKGDATASRACELLQTAAAEVEAITLAQMKTVDSAPVVAEDKHLKIVVPPAGAGDVGLGYVRFTASSAGKYHFIVDTIGAGVALSQGDGVYRGALLRSTGGGTNSDACDAVSGDKVYELDAVEYVVAASTQTPGAFGMVILPAQ